MSLCLKQGRVRLLYIKANYHETKQSIFRLFLSIITGCRERTAHFDARPKTMHSYGMFPVYGSQSNHANIPNH